MKGYPACTHTVTTTNYLAQAARAAELMQAKDAEMQALIEKMQAEGSTLVSIHYEF